MQLNQQPPDDLAQSFRQALQQQMDRTPQLAPWLVQRGEVLLERFTQFYHVLRWLPRWARRRWQRKLGASLAGAALALALSNTPVAYAAGITVTTNVPAINADGQCSLIEAIINANNDAATYADCVAGSGADTITLAGDFYGLSAINNVSTTGNNGLPLITSAITIQGNGATIGHGGPPSPIFFRMIEVANTGDLTFNDTTITGGAHTPGAGIFNNGGTLTLNNSTLRGNTNEFVSGGGIYNNGGAITLNNSTLRGNRAYSGGGIYNNGGAMTLINSTVSGNVAEFWDGAGIVNRGTMTLSNSTVSDNRTNGYDSGGIENHGTLTLTNSTVSGNRADSGGGIRNVSGTVTLANTIIANSVSGGDCVRNGGTINASHSLIEGGLGCVNGTNTNNLTGDPNLGPLQDNGGPTFTHALLSGSPAIDKGNNAAALNALGQPLTTDQRGAGFPRILYGTVDIGAFEFGNDTTPPTASPTQDPAADANGWNNTDVTVTWNWADDADGGGIDPAHCTTSSTSSGEGEIVLTATCADLAGNQGNGSDTIMVDKTPPTLNPLVNPNPVSQGAAATVTSGAADALSGLANESCGALDTSTAGVKSVTCTASDKAGNTASATVAYTVQAAGVLVGSCGSYNVYQVNGSYTAAGWSGSIKVGTNANNTINGANGADLILGLGGNDLIDGKGGDDVICGGDGVDQLLGAAGNDYLDGGNSNDVLNGGNGDYDTIIAGDGNDVLLDADGVLNAQGGPGNDAFTIALRNGWRNQSGQTRFGGIAAGYGNDAVGLAILNLTRFFVDITGDERDNPPSPLEGNNDALALVGRIDPASTIIKFETGAVISASAEEAPQSFEGFLVDPTTLTDESGAEFLTEPVGEDAPTEMEQTNRVFLPVVSR